jgi:alpha-L-rhamnosidase
MMKRISAVLIVSLFSLTVSAQKVIVKNLLCESQVNPVGIDSKWPRFNWQLMSENSGVLQKAYRIIVADNMFLLQKGVGNVWDSKKVISDQSIQIQYQGKALQSAKSYYWRAMVWDNKGETPGWSKTASWQMGLLTTNDWAGAKWIGYDQLPDSLHIAPFMPEMGDKRWKNVKDVLPLLRKEFINVKRVKKALIYISGLGQFDLSLNGKKVGDHFLDPGWTKYDKQALYVTFDVTSQIKQGKNAIGVMLGNGMYFIPGERYRKMEGAFGYPKMICRIVLQYADGTSKSIVSDNTWKATPGPVTFSSIYGGEDYDDNLEKIGWDKPGFNDNDWKQAIPVSGPPNLDAQMQPALKIFEHFKYQKITQPKPGVWVYDLGQNASGIPYIAVSGNKGTVIKISPAELLAKDGTITTNPIGTPVYLKYTLKGAGLETWQPRFMYYGFRYIQIDGAVPQGEANPTNLPVVSNIESLHTRSAADRIGTFSCSNDLFNKTFNLIDWAIQSNTASIFTDCPHREKLGWLEEAHLVGSSIRYNYDIANLCRKVITDMRLSQTSDGLIPDIAPEYVVFGGGFRDSPEWGSNGIILPWYVYQWYGDKEVLRDSYDMMARYVAYLESKSKNHILSFGLGDWYDIGPRPPGVSQLTPNGVTATAMHYYDLNILAKTAKLLGKTDDEIKYTNLAAEVKTAFNAKFFNKETRQYATGSQTANAVSVYMGLVEPQDKEAVIDNIVKDIRKRNNSLTAGDIGYRYLLRVLDDAGRSDVINDMNNRSDVPGYGYQLAKGATALTESWQGADNASNNHFMLGHLMEWFYSGLGGIRPAENSVAFREINIRPEPVDGVTSAQASYLSPYGLISSDWKKEGVSFYLKVEVPANTTATIYLPAKEDAMILENGKIVKQKTYQDGRTIIKVGSGKYSYKVD